MTGAVSEQDDLHRARDLIGRCAGVLAVWTAWRLPGENRSALDIGCADQKQYPDNIGVDVRRTRDVDADLTPHGGAAPTPKRFFD